MIILVAILFLTSFTVTALLSFFFKMPIGIPANTSMDTLKTHGIEYYIKPYCRYGPFLVGILIGMLLCYRETPIIQNKVQALLGWLLSLFSLFMVIALAYIINDSIDSYSITAAIYQALHRTLWAMGVSWIILACAGGYGGFVNQVLSWDIWNFLAKISYACYLVHPIYVFTYYAIQETAFHYTDLNLFYQFCGHSVLAFITGFVFSVIIEKPFQLIFHI
ncbi:O-acyltransferase like protein-like [Rhinatrema bivittatum]|uniref:O-acyltransferase like protein-like n=1 Tax=Rhinatrema bivittatum TaxID=194408 RepID=UPI00112DF028|nr:O-acyltransferase like protein-like [Rhinatrema bivittatum]